MLLIAMPHRDPQPLVTALAACAPEIPISVWPELPDREAIKMAVLWQHPQGLLESLPNLQVAHSFGAGVEHILDDPQLPPDTQIARVSGPKLAASMSDYLLRQVKQQESAGLKAKSNIGLLGYGQLARHAAEVFVERGYPVMAWRRQPTEIMDTHDSGLQQSMGTHNSGAESIDTHNFKVTSGQAGLKQMLQQSDVLICLLPLTAETENILNTDLFDQCRPDTYLINAGRGAHLVEQDLLGALKSNQLSGACLDVTRNEPISDSDPLSHHPKIKLTNHTASLTDPAEAASVIAENYRRMLNNQPLLFAVDRDAGY